MPSSNHSATTQRRTAFRWPISIRPDLAERATPDGWLAIRALITDLSAGGFRVRSLDPIEVGDLLDFLFAFPHGGADLRVRATPRHVAQTLRGSEQIWEAGCAFRGLRPAECDRIVQFIFSQQRAMARRTRGAA